MWWMCGCLVCPSWLEIGPSIRWCENIVFSDPSYSLHCCWFWTEILLWVWLHWLKNILDIILSYFLRSRSCQSWPLLDLCIPRSYQNNHGFFLWRLLFSRSHLGKFSLMNSIVTGTPVEFCEIYSCCWYAKIQSSDAHWLFYWIQRFYKGWW